MRGVLPRNSSAPQCGAEVVPSVITGMLLGLPGEGGLGLPNHHTAVRGMAGSPRIFPFPAQRAAPRDSNDRL